MYIDPSDREGRKTSSSIMEQEVNEATAALKGLLGISPVSTPSKKKSSSSSEMFDSTPVTKGKNNSNNKGYSNSPPHSNNSGRGSNKKKKNNSNKKKNNSNKNSNHSKHHNNNNQNQNKTGDDQSKNPTSRSSSSQRGEQSHGNKKNNSSTNASGSIVNHNNTNKKTKNNKQRKRNKNQQQNNGGGKTNNGNTNFAWSAFQSSPDASKLPIPAFATPPNNVKEIVTSKGGEAQLQLPAVSVLFPDDSKQTDLIPKKVVGEADNNDSSIARPPQQQTSKKTKDLESSDKAKKKSTSTVVSGPSSSANNAPSEKQKQQKTVSQHEQSKENGEPRIGSGVNLAKLTSLPNSQPQLDSASFSGNNRPLIADGNKRIQKNKKKGIGYDDNQLNGNSRFAQPSQQPLHNNANISATSQQQNQTSNLQQHQQQHHYQYQYNSIPHLNNQYPNHHLNQYPPPPGYVTIQVQVPPTVLMHGRQMVVTSPSGYPVRVIVPEGIPPGAIIPVHVPAGPPHQLPLHQMHPSHQMLHPAMNTHHLNHLMQQQQVLPNVGGTGGTSATPPGLSTQPSQLTSQNLYGGNSSTNNASNPAGAGSKTKTTGDRVVGVGKGGARNQENQSS